MVMKAPTKRSSYEKQLTKERDITAMARRMMSLDTIPLSYGKCVNNREKNLINRIRLLSRDEKIELLWQLDCAYTKIYNMECSTIKEDCIQSDAICELAKIHSIVRKSLQ